MARTDPRKPVSALDALLYWGDLCGMCAGHARIWCPDCYGFEGCATCMRLFRVPCPDCVGGSRFPITSYR
ncbi:hypothetical protein C0216_18115 [Streptomyces globosus]|uniref:Uncharacterized protein n=1 Tax=Streptomyces globosus TaxID=68209 RepID=A0A344U2I9_9ACTN|nr:hypothetical protein C0216_18115 [Streptomyces globosus]